MTVTFDTTRLFELLNPKLGAAESKAVVEALDVIPTIIKEVLQQLDTSKKDLAIKADILAMREDIHRLEIKMHEKFNSQLIWLIGIVFTATSLAIAIIKLA